MFKFRVGFFLYRHKLSIKSTASIITTPRCSYSKVAYTSLLANHLPRTHSPAIVPSRTFWETFGSQERSFHAKDELDKENYELVYRNKLFNYAFYGQLISELTVVSQTGYAIYLCLKYYFFDKVVPVVTKVGPFTVNYDLLSFGALGFFTIQNALIFIGAQKCLLRMYHKRDTDEYVFVSLALNPFKTRKVICKPGELKCLHVSNLMSFIKGNYETKDRRYYLRHEHFKTNYHYNRLVYDDY